jgi:hypothetical protein
MSRFSETFSAGAPLTHIEAGAHRGYKEKQPMKLRIVAVLFCTAAAVTLTQSGTAQERLRDREDLAEREEFRQSYKLAPGAQVEVRNINGPLELQTTDGDSAEVYVARSARTRADLEYYKVVVENAGGVFRVYTEQPPEEIRNHINVRHRAVLKVPRPAELTVRNINGQVRIGEIDGPVHMGNINGSLEIGHLAGFAELSNINGSIALTLERLGERGIHMRNINGGVSLRFLDQLNADLDLQSFNGSVDSVLPNTSVQKVTRSSVRGQIGTGGVPIIGSHVNGTISVRGGSER